MSKASSRCRPTCRSGTSRRRRADRIQQTRGRCVRDDSHVRDHHRRTSRRNLKQCHPFDRRQAVSGWNFDKDRDLLKAGGVFDDDFIDSTIELKMTEVIRFEHTPHPVEYEMYHSA